MKIVIGDYPDPEDSRNLILNDEVRDKAGQLLSRCFGYISKVEGLETAPYRNGTGDWSGTDGGYMSSQLYSARVITISGFYNDKMSWCDPAVFQSGDNFDHYARLYVRSRLPIRVLQACRIFLNNGLVFYTECYCTDLKMDYDKVDMGEFQITLYCPEPALFLGAGDGELGAEYLTSTLYKAKDVGYVNPYELSVVWGTGGRSAPVEYKGDFAYAPQIIARGPLVNPAFTLLETKQTFKLGYSSDKACVVRVTDTDAAGTVSRIGSILTTGFYGTDSPSPNPIGGTGRGLNLTYRQTAASFQGNTVTSLLIHNRGTGYEIGDLVKLVVTGSATDTPAYYTITGVDAMGGVLSYRLEASGSYPNATTMEGNFVPITGSGSGCQFDVTIRYTSIATAGYFNYVVDTIADGGAGYTVGDIIYCPPSHPSSQNTSAITLTTFIVDETSGDGAIKSLAIVNPGEYQTDCSAKRVGLISSQGSPGSEALVDIKMTQNPNTKLWSATDVTVIEGGRNYLENTDFVPQVWASTTFTISASQTLVIDMAEHTVTVDGASRSYFINPESEWFSLEPNTTNHIVFTSEGADDNKTAMIKWRTAYQGI